MGRKPIPQEDEKVNWSVTLSPEAVAVVEGSRKGMPRSKWIDRVILSNARKAQGKNDI